MDWKKRTKDIKQPPAQISAPGSAARARLPQRIGESASGLLKESFKQPSPRTVTGILEGTSLNTENAKTGSSSSTTGTGESSLAFRLSSQYEQASFDQGELFRSNEKGSKAVRTHGQVAFDQFAQDGPALSIDQQSRFSMGIAEDNMPRVQEMEISKIGNKKQDFAVRTNDGAAVIALLSDLALTVDEEPSSVLDLENAGGGALNYERLQVRKGPGSTVDALPPSIPLDLIPDFGAPWNSSPGSSATQKGIHGGGRFLNLRFGDVQPWIDISHKYHDEVWGYMLPSVQEAREEFKAVIENQTCGHKGPAIRRLKMVLQHLGGPIR